MNLTSLLPHAGANVVRSKQHGDLAVLAGHGFLVADEDSTIRQSRQHVVRQHFTVSLGIIPHDNAASLRVGLLQTYKLSVPRFAQLAP